MPDPTACAPSAIWKSAATNKNDLVRATTSELRGSAVSMKSPISAVGIAIMVSDVTIEKTNPTAKADQPARAMAIRSLAP